MAKFLKDMVNASHDEKILSAYDKEAEQRAASFSDGYDDGYDSGYGKGYKENAKEMVETMLQKNMNIKDIAEISKLTEKEINKIKSNMK